MSDLIIPANPGFEALGIWLDDEWLNKTPALKDIVVRTPVIAWRIPSEEGGPVVPIGLDDFRLADAQGVLQPNGEVFNRDACTFENIEAWVDDVLRQKRMARAVLGDNIEEGIPR